MKAEVEMKRGAEEKKSHLWNAMHKYNPNVKPTVAVSGEGSWFKDEEGNAYLDGVSGLWCLNLGYGRQEIVDAAAEQMMKLAYFPLTMNHQPAIQLANKLSELLGAAYQTFFSNGGSEANETAFKIARQYHQQTGNPGKYKFISRYRAYHGSTLGAMSATAQANRRFKYDPSAPGFLHVAPPYSYRSLFSGTSEEKDMRAADELEEMIRWEGEETVAAVIMEPFISGGGVIIPSMKYIERVSEICRKYHVLLIMDEVVSGFGRTGEMFGFKHANGIQPDIVTMAKGLTSGYLPLGATSVKAEIYEVFKQEGKDNHFRHVSTYGGHPAACAVGLKNIEIIEKEKIVDRVRQLGHSRLSELRNLQEHKHVGEVRQVGFLLGMEMVEDKSTKEPLSDSKMNEVVGACKQKGLIIGKNGDTVPGGNNILIIAPPLSSTEEDLDFIIETVKSVIRSI
ncbi:Adenosylmethionine-8-amino-7-oxononanoate aminotransferase [Lentibacillus persicus]|uniref:Adenosylmethionine-8-amino-7-oxononanoate aminotransferase n=1 Tax=Lentibacillus persicus TaxID=640948 RepID=A0A1I1WAE7_9BACI|nr:aminotransferase [Lentibacillus persicus]SFD90010.1 Adenosylmethionine-8-amino-7-oxononanoate aminotransferase [Lentibacillus persicus]